MLRLVNVRGTFVVNSPQIAGDLARCSEGIALCPDYVVQDDLAARTLEHALRTVCGPELDIHAVYLSQRRLPQRTRALSDFIGHEAEYKES